LRIALKRNCWTLVRMVRLLKFFVFFHDVRGNPDPRRACHLAKR